MNDRYQLELAAFDEKIALAELEEAKATQRVRELKYERARFQLDWRTQTKSGGVDRSQGSTT